MPSRVLKLFVGVEDLGLTAGHLFLGSMLKNKIFLVRGGERDTCFSYPLTLSGLISSGDGNESTTIIKPIYKRRYQNYDDAQTNRQLSVVLFTVFRLN